MNRFLFRRNNFDDCGILRLFRDGDPAAPRILYEKYSALLYAVCLRYVSVEMDAEDVLQDSFMTIFDRIGSFEDRGKGSLKAWMIRIVVNLSLKHLRNSSHFVFEDVETAEIPYEPETESLGPELLVKFIRSLPDGYRAVFNMYVVEGMSHKEIAGILGITESTSASQLHRAKAMLARTINKYWEEIR